MTNDNNDKSSNSFGAEMARAGVVPLKKRQEKVALRKAQKNTNHSILRAAATADSLQDDGLLQEGGMEWLGPHDVIEHRKAGIQHEVFKNLKQGKYRMGADLDLHNYRVEEARAALFRFINDCVARGIRHVIIIHGKGWHGQNDKATDDIDDTGNTKSKSRSRIKSHVVHWLKGMDSVLAFSSAQARDGGTGALYVLLRAAR